MSWLSNIAIGQYVPRESLVHQLDPRTKLLIAFFYVFIVFLANNWLTYTLLAVFSFAAFLLAKIPLPYMWKGLKPVWLILLLTFFFHLWFNREGEVLFSLGKLVIYEQGLVQGLSITLRIFFIVLVTSLLTLTTKPLEITDGLERLLAPLKRWKFPVHEFALMVSISLRFIPTLLQETEKIMKAQVARGAQFQKGNIIKRALHLLPILIPLFVSAFQRAEDLALAMEARGYRGGEGRTHLRVLQFRQKDGLAFLLFSILLISLFLLRGW